MYHVNTTCFKQNIKIGAKLGNNYFPSILLFPHVKGVDTSNNSGMQASDEGQNKWKKKTIITKQGPCLIFATILWVNMIWMHVPKNREKPS